VVDGSHCPMLLDTDLHSFRDAGIARIRGRQAVLPARYSIIQGSRDKKGFISKNLYKRISINHLLTGHRAPACRH